MGILRPTSTRTTRRDGHRAGRPGVPVTMTKSSGTLQNPIGAIEDMLSGGRNSPVSSLRLNPDGRRTVGSGSAPSRDMIGVRRCPGSDASMSPNNATAPLCPDDQFTSAVDCNGETQTLRVVEGHLFVCIGCCCGNTDRGRPAVPVDRFKSEWKQREVRKRLHLTISGCLGPCAVPNVVMLIYRNSTIWFHSINDDGDVVEIYDYIDNLLRTGRFTPPAGPLEEKVFQRYETDAGTCETSLVTAGISRTASEPAVDPV